MSPDPIHLERKGYIFSKGDNISDFLLALPLGENSFLLKKTPTNNGGKNIFARVASLTNVFIPLKENGYT